MTDNKDNPIDNNQDFIEGSDDFAQSMDDNFAVEEDDVIHVESDGVRDDFTDDGIVDEFEDEWAEDFGDDLPHDDFSHDPVQGGKPEKNWFNIGVFGVLGVVACLALYVYVVPMIFGSGGNSEQVVATQTPNQKDKISVETAQNNSDLAQQAVAPELVQLEEAGGLLANPELLGDGVTAVQRPNEDAIGNAVFEALENVSEQGKGDTDDIFAAIEDMQGQATENTSEPQILPAPSDVEPVLNIENSIFENLADADLPRPPSQTDNQDIAPVNIAEENSKNDASAEIVEPIADTGANTQQMQALNERMDSIMDRLDSLAQQVDTVANAEPVLSPASNTKTDVSALEKTIANLEKKISALSKQKATPVKRTSTSNQASQKRKRAAPKVSKPAAPQWELRGASPREAYVAERGTQNLRTVSVGDTLHGIGRIQSITMENGRWVVRGTSGRINQ